MYVYISYVVSIYRHVGMYISAMYSQFTVRYVCTSALYSLNLPSSMFVSVLCIVPFYRHVRIPVSISRHVGMYVMYAVCIN